MTQRFTDDDRYRYSVIETCLAIYGSMSGTGDPMTEVESQVLLDWLRWRVGDGWVEHSLLGWEPYESAIRSMAQKLLKAMDADDWAVETAALHGHVLTGKHAHWCVGWDGLPIDETCAEYHLSQVLPDDKDVPCAECGYYDACDGPYGSMWEGAALVTIDGFCVEVDDSGHLTLTTHLGVSIQIDPVEYKAICAVVKRYEAKWKGNNSEQE